MVAPVDPNDRVVIGITFGNSNSSIAYTVDDKAEVIANEDGDRQIPTVLSYVDGDEYYGAQAKAFLVRNPSNTIAYFRDFLGKEYVLEHQCAAGIVPDTKLTREIASSRLTPRIATPPPTPKMSLGTSPSR